MNIAKHTPGPTGVELGDWWDGLTHHDRLTAYRNAHAAPALYEALQVAQRYLEQCQGHDEEWQIVTDALAQAEGR